MKEINLIEFLESIGFEGYGTGGGCMAMYKEINDKGDHILITDSDAGIDTLKELMIDEKSNELVGDGGVCIGFYSNDGDCYFELSNRMGFTLIDADILRKGTE